MVVIAKKSSTPFANDSNQSSPPMAPSSEQRRLADGGLGAVATVAVVVAATVAVVTAVAGDDVGAVGVV